MMICFDDIIIKIVDREDLCKGDGKSESATSDERYMPQRRKVVMWFVRVSSEKYILFVRREVCLSSPYNKYSPTFLSIIS